MPQIADGEEPTMSPDIVLVREGDGYRILHGHLHLASQLSLRNEISVDVQNEGTVRIVRTRNGYFAAKDGQRLPLHRN
jgi:hypothetical protein